jgi:hypothetical protein
MPSCANGGSNTTPWPTASMKPATGCSRSRAFRRANGNRSHIQRDRTLHEEFKRGIKTRPCWPAPKTAAILFWALLASGQITMPKVDGWHTVAEKRADH